MTQDDTNHKTYNIRRILAQVAASVAVDFQYFSLGAASNFAAVEVAGLSNNDSDIPTTESDLSWIGSICFVLQAVGNLLGGPITEWVGRKRAIIYGNVPYILGWVLIWQSQDMKLLLAGNALQGFGTGLISAPLTAYIGEICQPSLRGTLSSFAEVFLSLGTFGVFLLGSILSWRITSIIYLSTSVFAILLLFVIPETPIWLLSQGREAEALQSLCWLRGWTKPDIVKDEFEELIMYDKNNQQCCKCYLVGRNSLKYPEKCTHSQETWWQRCSDTLSELRCLEALRPLVLASTFFAFSAMTSLTSVKPTMVNLLAAYRVPVDARWTMIYVGTITVVGSLICMSLVKLTGKRFLAIGSMLGSCICTLLFGLYAQYNVPPETTSFKEVDLGPGETSVIPLVLFLMMVCFNSVGIIPITWMIVSEIFPYNIRSLCGGFVGAVCELSFFIAAKTYIDIENTFHIYGAMYLYAAVTFAGVIYLYLFLIETENKSLEEIEESFTNKNNVCYADDWFARKILPFCCAKQADQQKKLSRPPEDKINDDDNPIIEISHL